MPTLTPGSSVEIDIPVGDSYAVTTPGEAYVDIVSGTIGAGYKTDRLVGGTQREQVYGPYPTAVKIRVRARTGGATYFKAPTETKDALDVVDLKAKISSSGGVVFSVGGKTISPLTADPSPPNGLYEDSLTVTSNDVIRMGGGYVKQVRGISGSAMVALNDSPDLSGRKLWTGTVAALDVIDVNLAALNGVSVSITGGTATITVTHGEIK